MGGTTQTTTATSEPPEYAKGLLEDTTNFASDLLNSGIGAQVYTGSTVTPWSDQTMQAMGDIEARAKANMNGNGLSGYMQGIMDNGGLTKQQQASSDYLDSIGTNAFDLSGNQAYQGYRTAALDDVQSRIDQTMAASGRYGSGAHTDNLVTELSNAANSMDLSQMSRMDGLNAQRANLGQQGFQNMGSAYTAQGLGAQDMMNIGAMNEDLYRRTMDDQLRIFNESQMLPWENLARANAIASGAGQFGTQTTTSQSPNNPWLTGISAGLSALGGWGSFL